MMPPSNNPDIAVAQEWIGQLEAWMDAHGLCGPDPFDVKQHPWIRTAQTYPLARKATTALCDLFPNATRRLLHVTPTENAKAHALVALGALRLHAVTARCARVSDPASEEETFGRRLCGVGDPRTAGGLHGIAGDPGPLARALAHLDWLRANACVGYSGLCWGYPFDVHGKGVDTPRGTPIGVVSAIAGQAFLAAHALTDDAAHLDAARSIAEFVLRDLPRLEAEDGTYCFAYTPTDRRRVHNANLLAVELLYALAKRTGSDALREAAAPALRYTLARQREDGAWPYGELAPGDAYEPRLLALVDHHHTGFVLRSLDAIDAAYPDDAIRNALALGMQYYVRTLFRPNGMPVNAYGAYPVDIHACAEAILSCSALSQRFPQAQRQAIATLRWTYVHLRAPRSGAPWYRKYPFHTTRLVCPRWGVAWLYRALAEYLYHMTLPQLSRGTD